MSEDKPIADYGAHSQGGPTLAALRVQADAAGSESEKPAPQPRALEWTTRHSAYDKTNPRAIAEDELLGMHAETVVLNLSGLWVRRPSFMRSVKPPKADTRRFVTLQGGTRDPINWLARVAPTKEALEQKGSLHLIHGLDVARAIVAVHLAERLPRSGGSAYEAAGEPEAEKEKEGRGQRWVLTDLHLVDWWDLASAHPSPSPPSSSLDKPPPTPDRAQWVRELLRKHNVRALPRSAQELGRAIDAREFWDAFGLAPVKARWEQGRA